MAAGRRRRARAVVAISVFLFCVLAGLALLRQRDCENNHKPVIGVLAVRRPSGRDCCYIAASYVKYVESAGGQVVPIFSNTSQDDLKTLFSSINGVLLPGGGASLDTSGYSMIARSLLEMAMEARGAGDFFPVWGTCLGFQLLASFIGGGNLRSPTDADNCSIPLNLTSAARSSRLFSLFPSFALEWVAHEPLTAHHHSYGITVETFQNNPNLTEFFTVLSTNVDRKGVEFVSTMESKKYPIYGVQWHPEKNGFEWGLNQAVNHSEHAVAVMQFTANFFVQEARRSSHRFSSEDARQKALIHNYSPFLRRGRFFEQLYVF